MDEILLNKKISIERCIQQIDRYYNLDNGIPFETDYLRQDAIAMNLQRACELTIDIANHLIRKLRLGLRQDSRDSFALLLRAGLISQEQMRGLHAMVGFRNTLVHQYQTIEFEILVRVIEGHLHELLQFANTALDAVG